MAACEFSLDGDILVPGDPATFPTAVPFFIVEDLGNTPLVLAFSAFDSSSSSAAILACSSRSSANIDSQLPSNIMLAVGLPGLCFASISSLGISICSSKSKCSISTAASTSDSHLQVVAPMVLSKK